MIRIKDIARKAEVSPTTVSNVIHGNHKKVSEEPGNRTNGNITARAMHLPIY